MRQDIYDTGVASSGMIACVGICVPASDRASRSRDVKADAGFGVSVVVHFPAMLAGPLDNSLVGVDIGAHVRYEWRAGGFQRAARKQLEDNLGVGVLVDNGEDDIDRLPGLEVLSLAQHQGFARVKAGTRLNPGDVWAGRCWLLRRAAGLDSDENGQDDYHHNKDGKQGADANQHVVPAAPLPWPDSLPRWSGRRLWPLGKGSRSGRSRAGVFNARSTVATKGGAGYQEGATGAATLLHK